MISYFARFFWRNYCSKCWQFIRFLNDFYVLSEWEYFFHLMRYCWLFFFRIFSIVYISSFSDSKWNVFCIDVLRSADFNNDILNTEETLILLDRFNSYVLSLLIFLMKNELTFTWFNFLFDFFVLRFLLSKYILFPFFSRDAIFCFLLIYLKKCCCILIMLLCTIRNVFIYFFVVSINTFDCLKFNKFGSRSKFT